MKNAARVRLVVVPALLTWASFAVPLEQPAVRATLKPVNERKPSPQFALKDTTGNTARLADYRGKAVLLNFWATWCTGCKKEIPWFSEFQKTYDAKGLSVLGIAMDEGGWDAVKPFLAQTNSGYRMLLDDHTAARQYGIEALPVTFLIDRQGRTAATYAGLVDKDDMETNIKALLLEAAPQ